MQVDPSSPELFLRVASTSFFLCILSWDGPYYNVAVTLYGLLVPNLQGRFYSSLFMWVLFISLVMDIVWCSLYGQAADAAAAAGAHAFQYALVMTIFNMFVKVFWLYLTFLWLGATGSTPLYILTPEIKSDADPNAYQQQNDFAPPPNPNYNNNSMGGYNPNPSMGGYTNDPNNNAQPMGGTNV